MWGQVVRAATSIVGGYFVALIVERSLGVMVDIAKGAPGNDSYGLVGAMSTVHNNFLLLVCIGIVVAFLARAHVEAQLTR